MLFASRIPERVDAALVVVADPDLADHAIAKRVDADRLGLQMSVTPGSDFRTDDDDHPVRVGEDPRGNEPEGVAREFRHAGV